jgi:hypothetical protein
MSTADNGASQSAEPVANAEANASPAAGENANQNPGQGGSNPNESDPQGRNWKNLREDRDYWRDRAAQLEGTSGNAGPRPREAAAPPADEVAAPTKKTLADFKYDENAYADYLDKQSSETARKAARDEINAENNRRADEARRTTYETKANDFAKANPTYHEAVRNPRFVQSPALLTEIMEADNGPAVALYLANNLDVTTRLNNSPPHVVAREVTKIAAKIAGEAAKAAANTNQLGGSGGEPPPNPTPKLDAKGDAGVKKDPAKMSDTEWWEARQKSSKKK